MQLVKLVLLLLNQQLDRFSVRGILTGSFLRRRCRTQSVTTGQSSVCGAFLAFRGHFLALDGVVDSFFPLLHNENLLLIFLG